MSHAPARLPTLAQVGLGLFIIWQLFFLLAANLLPFLPHGEPEEGELSDSRSLPQPAGAQDRFQGTVNRVAVLTDRWTQWTGQMQAWWLFAPDVPRQAVFPVVELRWQDEGEPEGTSGYSPVRLGSASEPEDPQAYFHAPGSPDRLFHYEVRLGLLFLLWDAQAVQAQPDVWRQAVAGRVRRQWQSIRAYLRWRVRRFLEEHPDWPPPQQAILSLRIEPAIPTGAESSLPAGAVEQPLARWRPGIAETTTSLPVEMCDPVTGRFVALPRKG